MFEITIKGNTPEELYDFMQELLHRRNPVAYPGKPGYQPPTDGQQSGNQMPPTIPAANIAHSQDASQPANIGTTAHHAAPTAPMTAHGTAPPAATPVSPDYAAVANTAPTTPMTTSPSNGVPIAPPPAYTLDQLAKAGAALAQAGKMNEALALLAKYGVQTVNQLKPEQYGAFATELRALGAQV